MQNATDIRRPEVIPRGLVQVQKIEVPPLERKEQREEAEDG
jgi:hypothetical protein